MSERDATLFNYDARKHRHNRDPGTSHAAAESARKQRELWRQASDEAMRAVEAAGVEIIRPDKAVFAEAVEEIYQELRAEPELFELADRIRGAGQPGTTP